MIDFWTVFFSVLFAFVVKDFYDVLIRSYVKKWLKRYKKLIENKLE
jgi:hypothetical protein